MTFIAVALVNSVMATLLAFGVWVVTRFVRQPAVAHALWLLVLLKFITPIFVEVPIPWNVGSDELASAKGENPHAPAVAPAPSIDFPSPVRTPVGNVLERTEARILNSLWSWVRDVLLLIWLIGIVVWIGVQTIQVLAFRRLLANAIAAPAEVQNQVSRLALCMGITRPPQAMLMDEHVSPMMWAFGRRASLVLPWELYESLEPEKLETLVAHELAHFRRADHWVRMLEVAVVGLFWWHPVAWLARRELHEAEEECCDAAVVAQLPNCSRNYAEAIIAAIGFLSEQRKPVPLMASGFGYPASLKKRILLIIAGRTASGLSEKTRVALLAMAMMILPAGPQGVLATEDLPETVPTFQERSTQLAGTLEEQLPASPELTISERIRLYSEVPILAVSLAHGNKRVVLQQEDGVYLKDYSSRLSILLTRDRPSTVMFSQDGSLLLTACGREVQVRETTTLAIRGQIKTGDFKVTSLAMDGNRRFAVGSSGGVVSVWDLRTCGLLRRWTVEAGSTVSAMRFGRAVDGLVVLTHHLRNGSDMLTCRDLKANRTCAIRRCSSQSEGQAWLNAAYWDEVLASSATDLLAKAIH